MTTLWIVMGWVYHAQFTGAINRKSPRWDYGFANITFIQKGSSEIYRGASNLTLLPFWPQRSGCFGHQPSKHFLVVSASRHDFMLHVIRGSVLLQNRPFMRYREKKLLYLAYRYPRFVAYIMVVSCFVRNASSRPPEVSEPGQMFSLVVAHPPK